MNRNRRRKSQKTTRHDSAALHHEATAALQRLDWDTAIGLLKRLVKLEPKNAAFWSDLGGACLQAGKAAEAENALGRALRLDPDAVHVLGNLANLRKQMGDAAGAAGFYRRILDLMPGSARAWEELSRVKRFTPDDPDIDAVADLLETGDLDDGERMYAEFAMGKALDDTGAYDAAFRHFAAANRLKRATLNFDLDAHEAAIEALMGAFDADFFLRNAGAGARDPRPVFVLGMPRSGTTLIEQILASHRHVVGAGELEDLGQVVTSMIPGFPGGAANLAAPDIAAMGTAYLGGLARFGRRARRVTDKMPRNFLFIGVIAAILPDARIIHCRRSPMDTCLSAFTLHFPFGQEFSYDLADLGGHYRLYRRLMEHWHRVLPGRIFDIAYEDVIAEPEQSARALVAHCELDWDDACLAFHKTKRQVATASAAQVREPVYATSMDRWRRYGDHLAPLRAALGDLADPL